MLESVSEGNQCQWWKVKLRFIYKILCLREEIRGWGFSQSNLGLSFFWSNLGLSFARNSFCGNYCWFMKILGLKSMPGAGISFQSNPLKEKLVFLSQKGFHGVSWNFTSQWKNRKEWSSLPTDNNMTWGHLIIIIKKCQHITLNNLSPFLLYLYIAGKE